MHDNETMVNGELIEAGHPLANACPSLLACPSSPVRKMTAAL